MDRRTVGYILLICAAALAAVVYTDWDGLVHLPSASFAGLAGLIAIGVLSEALAIGLSVGSSASTSSITFLPLLAGVQLFGPGAAVLLIAITQFFGEFAVRKKGLLRGSFNVAQMVLASAVAGWAFTLLGGVPFRGPEGLEQPDIASQIWPFICFGLLVIAINHAAVSFAIALSQGLPFGKVWDRVLSNSGASLNDLLISPIALAVAFLYVQFGIAGILVVILPMLFIRYSYLTTSKLRDANQDLLTALVKAIETRDPYTSGHSQRVSRLARDIADELGLGRITAEQIETAALLHDIGKIEAIYTDILGKPDALTAEERGIIESHVAKGEQLLRDLSSVPEEVILAVRHHHEREDGQGYPDRLLGDEIPIGAKIIIVCDAVDAMLSDRPYRRALPLAIVLEQLQEHAGRQFDHRIVRALMTSELLANYAELMRRVRDKPDSETAQPGRLPSSGVGRLPARLVQSTPSWPHRAYH